MDIQGRLPSYEALDPKPALEYLKGAIEKIESGEFKVVKFSANTQYEILQIPVEGAKPRTESTGKTVKTLELKLSNIVEE